MWQYQVISLAGAAEKLLGPSVGNMTDKGMKTKVRRLYDIANVLTSLRLIDKVRRLARHSLQAHTLTSGASSFPLR